MKRDEATEALMQQLLQSAQVLIDEVTATWRQAHAEARRAYEHWRASPGSTAYARYRAAQDQADSAQDALWVHHSLNGEF
jgi:hypothetical protein